MERFHLSKRYCIALRRTTFLPPASWRVSSGVFYEQTAELHGYDSKDELLGKSALKLAAPCDYKRIEKSISKTIKLGLVIRNNEYRLLRKDGSESWGELNARVLNDAFGKPTGVIAIIRDISERKHSEEMLHRSQEKLRSILKEIPDNLLHIRRDGTLVDEPMGYNRMLEYYPSALHGKTLHDILPSDLTGKLLKAIKKALNNNNLQVLEYQWGSAPENSSMYEIRIAPCGIDEVITIIRDITDQKRSRERLLTYQQHLQSLTSQLSQAEERERRRLSADLHDLISQPLAVIKMKLNTWKDALYFSGHSSDIRAVLELLESAINNTRSLTFDLSPPILYELGLEAGLEALLEQFNERYGIQYEYEDDGHEKLLKDEVGILLYRCAGELLMNVVKHANAQLVKLSISREDNQVLITIEDDGIGFAISEIGRRTQWFGLFSIRERLNWINGSFTIRSEPGCGTHATLKAPLEQIKNGI